MEKEKIEVCPFCGSEAGYDPEEMRFECGNDQCKAVVWFDFDVPEDADEKRYIRSGNVDRWNKRIGDKTISALLYDSCQRKTSEFMTSIYGIAKYGGLADALNKAKQLIREIQTDLDSMELSEELLKAIERLDRQ